MKRNLTLFVFVAVMAITNAQMFNQLKMDFTNFPSMKKNSETFGFGGSNNMKMGMPDDFQQIKNKPNIAFSLNSQQIQPTQSFQNFPSSQTN